MSDSRSSPKRTLDAGDVGFAVLVTVYGVGFIGGSLSGAQGGAPAFLKRRYLLGGFLMALGFMTSGLAPSVAAAVVTFLAAGYGNGLLLVYERLLIQAPCRMLRGARLRVAMRSRHGRSPRASSWGRCSAGSARRR